MTDIPTILSVYQQLKQAILHGQLKPASRLVVAKLKADYQAGATPIREALSQLLSEGLVEIENQKGFRVKSISLTECHDIYQARARIEQLCVEYALAKRNDDWEASVIASYHPLKKRSQEATPQMDFQGWEALHHRFHNSLAEGCRSETLLQIRAALYEKATRYRNLWLQNNMVRREIFSANFTEHETLLNAVLAGEDSVVLELIGRHLMRPVALIEAAWQRING